MGVNTGRAAMQATLDTNANVGASRVKGRSIPPTAQKMSSRMFTFKILHSPGPMRYAVPRRRRRSLRYSDRQRLAQGYGALGKSVRTGRAQPPENLGRACPANEPKATKTSLARIIHERFVGLRVAHRKTDEYTEKVADSLHYRLEAPKIEFPLFVNKTRLRE
jgi:hypothetical protein